MRSYEARPERLEARWPRPESHCVPVVCTLWDLGEADEARWVSEAVTCACGRRGCPELQIGALLPGKAPSADAWGARDQGYRWGAAMAELRRPPAVTRL
jgi:hypothetical protein